MFGIDKVLSLWLFNLQNNLGIGGIAKFFGVYSVWILLLMFVFLFLKEKDARRRIYTFGMFIILLVVSGGITTEIIRYFYHRPRPFLVLNIIPLSLGIKTYSFPSGHTIAMFSIAFVILLFRRRLFGYIAIILAIIGAIARVMMGVHWLSDVVGGALIALIIFLIFYLWLLPYKKIMHLDKTKSKHLDLDK